MVRRTKEDSEQTRLAIIAAARKAFLRRGVTLTTMEQIAATAGVTRGAVYWHFANKMTLFYAMRDQVTLPLMDRTDLELLGQSHANPLERIQRFLNLVMDSVVGCETVRQTFEIMAFKCEYVEQCHGELVAALTVHEELAEKLGLAYREAARLKLLRAGLAPDIAAASTVVFLSGLIRLWLMDDHGTLVRKHVAKLIAAHVAGHRAPGANNQRRHAHSRCK